MTVDPNFPGEGPWTVSELHWAAKLIAHELRRSDGNPESREVLFDSLELFLDQLLERLPPPPPLAARPIRSHSSERLPAVNGSATLVPQRSRNRG